MQGRSKARLGVGSLVLSAVALAGIAGFEGYRSKAYVPVPGDVVTIGHGTTRYESGAPVRMGDVVTPERARELLQDDVGKFSNAVRLCAPVPMHTYEFDAFTSLAYNIGTGAFCRSTLVQKLKVGDYAGACKAILSWDKFKGQPLRGLTLRRQAEYKQCTGETP